MNTSSSCANFFSLLPSPPRKKKVQPEPEEGPPCISNALERVILKRPLNSNSILPHFLLCSQEGHFGSGVFVSRKAAAGFPKSGGRVWVGTKQKVLKSGTIVGKVRFYVSAFTSDACGTKIAFAHRIFPIRNRTIGETLFKARDTKNNKYVFLHLRKKRKIKPSRLSIGLTSPPDPSKPNGRHTYLVLRGEITPLFLFCLLQKQLFVSAFLV